MKNKESLHLDVLDGVRSLMTIGIIFIHVQFLFGQLFYHSATPCYVAITRLPFIRNMEKPSFHLNTFWMISGFLCEYQLTSLLHNNKEHLAPPPWSEFIKFFFNRIIRIMPLYALCVFIMVHSRGDDNAMWNVVPALTFTTYPYGSGPSLYALHGWTLQNDVHGYLLLTLFAIASTTTTQLPVFKVLRHNKTIVYWALYGLSVAVQLSRKPFDWHHLSGAALVDYRNRAYGGLDYSSPVELRILDKHGAGLADLWPSMPFDDQAFAYVRHRMYNVYMSGLIGHGGSFFLGAALFSSLHANQGKATNLWIKVLIACFILYKTNADFVLSGFPIYFIMEALLCQNPKSPLAFLRRFLSSQAWKWFSPYSFGVYIVHMFVLGVRSDWSVVQRANAIRAGQPPCKDYSVLFLLQETILCFWISLAISIALYCTIELPFRVLRKRYLSLSSRVVDETSNTTRSKKKEN